MLLTNPGFHQLEDYSCTAVKCEFLKGVLQLRWLYYVDLTQIVAACVPWVLQEYLIRILCSQHQLWQINKLQGEEISSFSEAGGLPPDPEKKGIVWCHDWEIDACEPISAGTFYKEWATLTLKLDILPCMLLNSVATLEDWDCTAAE